MGNYWLRADWEDYANDEERLKAIYNMMQFVSREMSVGRVPQNKKELENNINNLNTPLSIAFVKMAENGDIDEVTANENVDMFLEWDDKSFYNINDLRNYKGQLYKCLNAHNSQADWTPDVSASLWKKVGIAENGINQWSRPISSFDAYNIGDEVIYNGVHYRSIIDNNVWSPEEYSSGWETV